MAITPNTTFVSGNVLTANQMNRLPWGVMAYASATANQTGIAAAADVTGLSVTFTANSTRIYVTSVYIGYAEQLAAAAYPEVRIVDGSNVEKARATKYLTAGVGDGFWVRVVETGLSGSVTRKARAQTSSGSLTITAGATYPNQILVEDIGEA